MNKLALKITENDLYKAQLIHGRFNGSRIVAALTMTPLVCLFLIENAALQQSTVIWSGAGYLTWYFTYFLIYLRYKSRKIFRQQKSLHETSAVSWDKEHLEFTSPSGNAIMKWADYSRYAESNDLLLLYLSDPLFHIFPKRCFASAEMLEDFRSNLAKIN